MHLETLTCGLLALEVFEVVDVLDVYEVLEMLEAMEVFKGLEVFKVSYERTNWFACSA